MATDYAGKLVAEAIDRAFGAGGPGGPGIDPAYLEGIAMALGGARRDHGIYVGPAGSVAESLDGVAEAINNLAEAVRELKGGGGSDG